MNPHPPTTGGLYVWSHHQVPDLLAFPVPEFAFLLFAYMGVAQSSVVVLFESECGQWYKMLSFFVLLLFPIAFMLFVAMSVSWCIFNGLVGLWEGTTVFE